MIMTIPSDLIGPVSGKSIGTDEGRLTDSEGHLLAHGTTTCLIIDR
jgi:acyl-coenzyme A thioesterase PaaI-like protein